jgi:predicted MPP superfamily phosphohydrolase
MRSRVRIFFTVFLCVFGVLHLWTLFVLTDDFSLNPVYNWILTVIFAFGLALIPIGYNMGHKIPRTRAYFLTWLGFIWMGTFFIGFSVGTFYFIAKIFMPTLSVNAYSVAGLILVLALWSLYKGTQDPAVRLEKVKLEKSLKPFKVVQITDLHVGLLRHNKAWLERIVEKINALDADFVVLTGDLVEGKWEIVRPMVEPLANVKARIAKIFVSGNHEFIYGGIPWEKAIGDLNWTILHNENKIYDIKGQKILMAGVPDRMVKRFAPSLASKPDDALKTNHQVDLKILLAHEPASVWDLQTEKPDLILSGHTHGGQIFPFNGLVRMAQPVVAGWKTMKGIRVFAHIGTGLWGPPMRLGTENRIVLLEISGTNKT